MRLEKKRRSGEHVPSIYEISIIRKDGKIRKLEVFFKQLLWNGEIPIRLVIRIEYFKCLRQLAKKWV